jgi:hypothetical protein
MSPTNGHANDSANTSTTAVQQIRTPASDINVPTALTSTSTRVKELIANLEVPFHPSVIEWRVTNTSKGGSPRGQVMPYADRRAYTDRLNALVTPAGWTRRYAVHTSANFERSKDQRIVAKVLVTCELTIFGLGSHAATGEEWADDDNAATAAEAQSFKTGLFLFWTRALLNWPRFRVLSFHSWAVRLDYGYDNTQPNGLGTTNRFVRCYPANPTGADPHNRMDECGGCGIPLGSLEGA